MNWGYDYYMQRRGNLTSYCLRRRWETLFGLWDIFVNLHTASRWTGRE